MNKPVLLAAALALSLSAVAHAQTGTPRAKPTGAMTINQASGGGVPHAPRTGRQPTKVAPHPSAGTANRRPGGAHATTSRGMGTGASKGPQAKPTSR